MKHNDGSMAMSVITRFHKSNYSSQHFKRFKGYTSQINHQEGKEQSMFPQSYVDIGKRMSAKQYTKETKAKKFNAQALFASIPDENENTSSIQAFCDTSKVQNKLWSNGIAMSLGYNIRCDEILCEGMC